MTVGNGVGVAGGMGVDVAVDSDVGVSVTVGKGARVAVKVGVRVGEGDGGALGGETSGVTDGMGVTVNVLLNNVRDDGAEVAITVEVGLTVAASTDWTAGACSGGGAATSVGLQPIAIKDAAIARAKADSNPR